MISETKKAVLEWFAKGRNFYKLMKFQEAKGCFAQALKLDPKDGPSIVYFKRCAEYVKSPPPEDWDGVIVRTTK
ncbi:MAG: tetratricopeptide repeat protein [Spirochaetales bacterium]|nr:tetratricopeptide repeat protein [Spirochaetales bacterium]